MIETELKFQIPAEQLAGVRQALTSPQDARLGPVETLQLHAAYFDTAAHALARRRCALRVRRENDDWVQTFKGAGADAMTGGTGDDIYFVDDAGDTTITRQRASPGASERTISRPPW